MKIFLLTLVWVYRNTHIWAMLGGVPVSASTCRFYPSCSEYATLSIKKHGAAKGGIKTVLRILKCNPFLKGGINLP